MNIDTRLSKLEAKSWQSPEIFFWAMNGCRPMTAREIEDGIAALNLPTNATVTSVRWMGGSER
jgi:hypothetical protein